MIKLLTGLRKIFNFKIFNFSGKYLNNLNIINIRRLIKQLNSKYKSRTFLYIFFVFTKNYSSFASSWIPSNSILVQSFDFYDKYSTTFLSGKKPEKKDNFRKFSRNIFIEEGIGKAKNCSVGINLFQLSDLMQNHIKKKYIDSYFSIFYKYNIFKKKNTLITFHFPFALSKSYLSEKPEIIYGIGISRGNSKMFNKNVRKNRKKTKPISVFSDWGCNFLVSSNKNKKNIYKVEEKIGLSFRSLEFISENIVEMYEYKSESIKTNINRIRTDIKIGIKLRENSSLYLGIFRTFYFEKNFIKKIKTVSSGVSFSYIIKS